MLMLQKLAVTASWWILAITVSEMMLNPIVYYYLKAPEPELVLLRERGLFRQAINAFVAKLISVPGKTLTMGVWIAATALGLFLMRGATIGDPEAASPLLFSDSPYNQSHTQIQGKFGGVEPLIIVSEGYDKNAMKDPKTLKTMENFQRFLERDETVGYSFSLSDILRAVNSVFHELEPKWSVIPNNWVDIGGLFFIFFSGSPPTETAKYVSTDYATAHVTFFCKDHKGENIRRVIARSKEFIAGDQLTDIGIEVAEDEKGMYVKAVHDEPRWEDTAGTFTIASAVPDADEEGNEIPIQYAQPFAVGDRIVGVGSLDVHNVASLNEALVEETAKTKIIRLHVEKDGVQTDVRIDPPWKSVLKLAGGLIGVLAAANEALVRNDLLMNFLGFFTVWVILLFTYRSAACGLYLLGPLICSNILVNGYMAVNGIGINVHTLPLVTVGVGFGIDYGLYIVSRVIEEIRVRGDLQDSVREALVTSGKAVTFTAITMIVSTLFWITSSIRFNAEMGLLLAIWMTISYIGSQTLLPVLILLFKPNFIMKEAFHSENRKLVRF
ncbi:MAG: hypothetical protein E4H00_07115 [Myxococcales bacterium]|nr:MAG: hypothetical protein E4H00_07115 [Myxococcales bacterium]